MVSEGSYFEDAAHELVEEARGRKAVGRAFARESARTYADLLDDLFFYYRESVRAAERGTREGW
jgi:hypothetical protein